MIGRLNPLLLTWWLLLDGTETIATMMTTTAAEDDLIHTCRFCPRLSHSVRVDFYTHSYMSKSWGLIRPAVMRTTAAKIVSQVENAGTFTKGAAAIHYRLRSSEAKAI